MIKALEKTLNFVVEFIHFFPEIFMNNELFVAYSKMKEGVTEKSTEDEVDEILDEIVANPDRFKEQKPPAKSLADRHAASLQRTHSMNNQMHNVLVREGVTSSFCHRRKGFVIQIGKHHQFIAEETVRDLVGSDRIYAVIDRMKHQAEMDRMSEELDKNAKASEILMRTTGGSVKHVGFIGAQHPARTHPMKLI